MAAAAAAAGGKSREDRQKEKALLEARKAGTVAPEKDADGNDINPHIPAYIANAPWYLNATAPGLKHQKSTTEKQTDKTWYTRGATQGPTATKYRKGACTNCGAITHDAKSCVERPRKLGARWTGRDIRADEVIQEVRLDYEGKRDRWNGYDPESHALLMQRFEKTEEEKRKRKEEALQQGYAESDAAQKPASGAAKAGADGAEMPVEKVDEDEFGIADDSGVNDAPIAKMDPKTRSTIRNLRIREDTAKYLRNLDPESAYYDPKSRSMREDPTPHIAPEDKQFAGDNFVRGTGEVAKFHEVNSFAWDAYERGQDVHLQALPSQAELLLRQFKEKKEQLKKDVKSELLAKYGGAEHLAAPKELLPEQSESYVEYSRHGKPIKGAEKAETQSRYEEDVLVNNHTKVWGSWWENGKWGYGCCRQLLKNSFCTGQAGISAKESVIETQLANAQRATQKPEGSAGGASSSSLAPKARQPFEKEAQPELDPIMLERAMQAEEKRRQQPVERDERKRAYNSLATGSSEVTQEEMEAYRRRKTMMDDPMRDMKDTTS